MIKFRGISILTCGWFCLNEHGHILSSGSKPHGWVYIPWYCEIPWYCKSLAPVTSWLISEWTGPTWNRHTTHSPIRYNLGFFLKRDLWCWFIIISFWDFLEAKENLIKNCVFTNTAAFLTHFCSQGFLVDSFVKKKWNTYNSLR